MTYFNPDTTVAEAKAQLLLETKKEAFELLEPFDWYIIRFIELGTTNPVAAMIPANVAAYRNGIRAVSIQRCALINACTTVEELEALRVRPYWDIAAQYDTLTRTYSGTGDPTAFQPWPDRNPDVLVNYTV